MGCQEGRGPGWPGVLPGVGSGKWRALVGEQLSESTVLRKAGLPAKQAELGWAQHSVAANKAKH